MACAWPGSSISARRVCVAAARIRRLRARHRRKSRHRDPSSPVRHALLLQLGVLIRQAPALVFGQMPVKDVTCVGPSSRGSASQSRREKVAASRCIPKPGQRGVLYLRAGKLSRRRSRRAAAGGSSAHRRKSGRSQAQSSSPMDRLGTLVCSRILFQDELRRRRPPEQRRHRREGRTAGRPRWPSRER